LEMVGERDLVSRCAMLDGERKGEKRARNKLPGPMLILFKPACLGDEITVAPRQKTARDLFEKRPVVKVF